MNPPDVGEDVDVRSLEAAAAAVFAERQSSIADHPDYSGETAYFIGPIKKTA